MATADHRLAFGNADEYITGDGTDLKIVSSGDVDITAISRYNWCINNFRIINNGGKVVVDDATEATT